MCVQGSVGCVYEEGSVGCVYEGSVHSCFASSLFLMSISLIFCAASLQFDRTTQFVTVSTLKLVYSVSTTFSPTRISPLSTSFASSCF